MDSHQPKGEPIQSGFQLSQTEKQWLAAHPRISVGHMRDWAPFSFVNQNGVSSGISVDYVKALNKRLHGALVLEPGNWANLYESVKRKRVDVILDITAKPEREAFFHFTVPYLDIPHVFVTRKDHSSLDNVDAMSGKTVALEKGFGNVEYFKRNYPKILIREYPNTHQALEAVSRGDVEAYAGNRSAAVYLMRQKVMNNLKVNGVLNKKGSILSIGVRKDWPILREILNRALADMTQMEIQQIHQNWLERYYDSEIALTPAERLWLEKHPVIHIAYDEAFVPYSYRGHDQKFVGVSIDIVKELGKRLGVEFSVYPSGNWSELFKAAKKGDVDVIATLEERPERMKDFNFSQPYVSLSQYMVTRKSEIQAFQQPSALTGKRVALVRDYSTAVRALQEVKEIQPLFVENLQQAFYAVSTGQADATIADAGMAQHLFAQTGLQNLGLAGLYSADKSLQRFGVRKDWPELSSILDKALNSLSYRDYLSIYAKWQIQEHVDTLDEMRPFKDRLSKQEKAWLAEHPIVRLGSDYAWPPFAQVTQDGSYKGIVADYMKLVEARLGIKFESSPILPWLDIVNSVSAKRLDVLDAAQATKERQESILFTEPYITQPIVIVTRDNVGYVNGLSALAGKTVAYEHGYEPFEHVLSLHPEIKQQTFANSLQALRAVSNGEVFAYLGNIATVSYLMRNQAITNVKVSGQLEQHFELSVGVRNDWPLLLSALQKALDSVTLEEKDAIYQKWVKVKVDSGLGGWEIVQYLAIAVGIVLLFLVWNVSLKRKVRAVTEQLQYRSYHDAMTDLPNRYLIQDRLSQLIKEAQREDEYVAVLTIGLDNLTKINSSLGFAEGDQFIIEFSKRIQSSVRTGDTVGRFDGDTFIVLMGGLKSPREMDREAETLLNQFRMAYMVNGRELNVTASVGIALYPTDGVEVQTMLHYSGAALQYAKKNGKNNFSFYTRAMNEVVNRKLQLDEAMSGALERGEFQPHYQPKVIIKTGEICGFEILLRWHHPELGWVSPDEFIPVAEENGLILPIGEFVLQEALRQIALWKSEFGTNLSMAVNLSPVQLRESDLVNKVETMLRFSGVEAKFLELEITEGVLVDECQSVQTSLNALKALGLNVSMDDFGTGYSSLSYLRKYPFDIIKIDREFIMDLEVVQNNKELVIATIAMAHSLGLQVVAEGVETAQQLAFLDVHNCDIAQGYYFSKPIPANQVGKLFN
ncbi:MAG: transporter substrate-binding domain-containing protein [Thiomicrorhabdus chilensis]|nr:transporter substrate-binding domain-containing protein [Thiomicrorhabdus chilensis]MDX1347093.1 transporter substrate-binding domain-containing protein [Thiomicrorhabdus chilensis]